MKKAFKLFDSFKDWWGSGASAPVKKKRKYKKRKK